MKVRLKRIVMLLMIMSLIGSLTVSAKDAQPAEMSENTIRIYYERADQSFDEWGLWLWGDVEVPSEQAGSWPIGATAFSSQQTEQNRAYIDIKVKENAASLNFIVVNRQTGEKDGGNKVFTQFEEAGEIYVKEGDDTVYLNSKGVHKPGKSKAHFPKWSDDSVIYEVNVRQYTKEGTFEAFEQHLPRLKKLGVEILWFMPIHPISEDGRIGTLGSYYAVQDYKAINPEFGSMEDFKRLVDKAHKMGFKVLLDWVGNHTGKDHIWTENKDWYTLDKEGNITHPPGTNWLDVSDLNYDNQEMRNAMMEAMKYWVEEADIDGYRADYASGVPVDFWEQARKELDKIKPVYMLAEDNIKPNLLNEAFNANYGWELNHIMREVASESKGISSIDAYLSKVNALYPKGSYPMHWTSNHDDNSWEGTSAELFGDAEKTMAALTFVMPGVPLIYSGQEAGLNKRLAFFDKDEISWNDLSMQDYYTQLVKLKKENKALWNGSAGGKVERIETSSDQVLSFSRSKGKSKVIVFANLSSSTTAFTTDAAAGKYKIFGGDQYFSGKEDKKVQLEPWEVLILSK